MLVWGWGWLGVFAAAAVAVVTIASPLNFGNVKVVWDARTVNQGSASLALGPFRRASMLAFRAPPGTARDVDDLLTNTYF